jgi:hypothetical protein
MKKIIVYHDNETLASRSRKPRPGETVSYRSIKDWQEKENAKFDEVINLSKVKPEKPKEKEPSHVKS